MIRKLAAGIACIIMGISQPLFAQQKVVSKALDGLSNAEKIVAEADQWITKIDGAVKQVEDSKLYRTLVDGASVSFPFAILPDNGDTKYALVVESVKMDAIKGMTATIMMKIAFDSKTSLYFLADAVPLSKSGQLSGDFKLYLVKSVTASVGDGYDLTFKGMDKAGAEATYVDFDCRGFKKINVNGTVDFDPKTIETYKSDGSAGQPVSLDFLIRADKLANFLVYLDKIPDLQFKSLPGFKCSIPTITVDCSDLDNVPNFKLPDWYLTDLKSKYASLDVSIYTSAIWQGVYVPTFTLEIPKSFSEGSKAGSVKLAIKDFILDEKGVSVLADVTNNVVQGGDMKGFKFDLDKLNIKLFASQLSKAEFAGTILLPVAKDETASRLSLAIMLSEKTTGGLDVKGSASLSNSAGLINVDAFGNATMKLTGCRVDFEYTNNQFFPKATLDGSLSVGVPKEKGSSTDIGGINFDFGGFYLDSRSPYIGLGLPIDAKLGSAGYFRMSKTAKSTLSNLPISFEKVGILTQPDKGRFGLNLAIAVHLMGSGNSSEGSSGFSGKADFTVWAKQESSKRWAYDDFELNKIQLDIDNGAYELHGQLAMFRDNADYGNGMCGYLDINIIKKIQVKAGAMFGTKTEGNEEYRYWFVDAMAGFTPGIPVFTGVEINSFTGGLYHHMKMELTGGTADETCKTASGRKFVANKSVFVGVMAGLGMQSTGTGTAFNGKINFGIQINTNGGIDNITTWGGVGIMTTGYAPPKIEDVAKSMATNGSDIPKSATIVKKPTDISGSVMGTWFVMYDFPTSTFAGDFDVFVNVANVIKGINANDHAGRISIYSSPDKWYFYVGQPVGMVGLDVLGLAQIGGYFCVGSQLPTPAMAPMPRGMQPKVNIDYNMLGLGSGMAFGARFSSGGKPHISLGLCSAEAGLRFSVGAGCDVLIAQSVEPIKCDNVGIDSRGIDQWYATGQAYIYGEAAVYVSWDCWYFGSGNEDVLSLTLQAYVFAQLPRPSYFEGSVAVSFKVLGERFHESFDVEFGDICKSSADANTMSFIASVTPTDKTSDVAVNQDIVVTFSKPLETFEYTITQSNSSAASVYRPILKNNNGEIKNYGLVIESSDGKLIEFDYKFNDDKTSVLLKPKRVLPENTDIKVTVRVVNQVKNGSTWKDLSKIEELSVTFKTTTESETIPVSAIKYAYPLPSMQNFYKEEYQRGYIQLNILPNKPIVMPAGYSFNLAICEGDNEIDRVRDVTYNSATGLFEFPIPYIRMDMNKEYTLKLLKSPLQSNVSETNTTEKNVTMGKVAEVKPDKLICSYTFKTSSYATFKDKMSYYSTSLAEVFNGVISAELTVSKSKQNGGVYEGFSNAEVSGYFNSGVRTSSQLIQTGAMLNGQVSDLSLQQGSAGLVLTSDVFATANEKLKKANINCLLAGSCPANAKTQIPAGSFLLPIEYHLPGLDKVTSTFNISINLPTSITLPR